MDKTGGIFLNFGCNCQRVASLFIKNHRTRFDNAMNKWSIPHYLNAYFFHLTHRPNKSIAVITSNKRKD